MKSTATTPALPSYGSIDEVIQAIMKKLDLDGFRYTISSPYPLPGRARQITFTSPRGFTFWTYELKPSSPNSWDMRIIPEYHPCMRHGDKRTVHLCVDATRTLRRTGVYRIDPPQEALANPSDFSWAHMNNPFSARGKEFTILVDIDAIKTRGGYETLYDLLRGALEIDGAWIGVSGGFRAPLPHGYNRIMELGISSPYRDPNDRGHLARGYEEQCVWAYRFLETEGTLKDAHIPEWFIKEGWLDIYEGVTPKYGLFF